jgi:hypothetical protein
VIQASLRRKLLLKTCRNSLARVNLSCLEKDSPACSPTSGREARSSFGPASANHATAATGLHTRAKTVRPGSLEITGLKCTFHIERLCSLFVDFNKARQCTGSAAFRQYLFDPLSIFFSFPADDPAHARIGEQKTPVFTPASLLGLWISIILSVCRSRYG